MYICNKLRKSMKKFLLPLVAVLIPICVQAQNVRANYRVDGMTHIAAWPAEIQMGDVPAMVNAEFVGFPDGSTLYLLHITLNQEKKAATAAPKGVKMALTLPGGKIIRLEQIGQFPTSSKSTRLKYAIETEDMEKIIKGVKSAEILTGWDPEDYVQATFGADELARLLKGQCTAIKDAAASTCEIKATLAERQENLGSTLTTTNPLVARGDKYDYNILLSHLYYKNSGKEDVDLFFMIGATEQFHIPFDSIVRFFLADGSEIGILQARDDVNFLCVYPSIEDITKMVNVGISRIVIDCDGGKIEDRFSAREDGADSFSDVLRNQMQLIYYISSL